MRRQHDQKPGDLFIDRYMPHATADEREAAHQRLRQLIGVLMRVNDRLAREERPRADSRDVGE